MNQKLILIASNNKHKIAQMQEMFGEEYKMVSMAELGYTDEIEETGTTIEENSMIKAMHIYEKSKIAVIADDSGIEVDYLNGAPGVYSARFAGVHGDDEANNDLLLEQLSDVKDPHRTGKFVCVLTYIDENGKKYVARGELDGKILYERRGSEGFGYDPLFYIEELGKTMAEISVAEKSKISHRGRAIQKLKELINNK